MKNIFKQICAVAVAAVLAGCSLFTSQTENLANNADALFNAALESAVTVLASEGTQQLAIAAAESFIASQVEDEQAQAIANQLIEAAVPALANSIAKQEVSKALTASEKRDVRYAKCVESEQFKKLVADCAKQYRAKVK